MQEKEFKATTFELLDYNKVLSDFFIKTPHGPIREFVNRTINVPCTATVFKNGKPIVYRYRANCETTIVQSEQVKIDATLYGANVPNTVEDMNDLKFTKGLLTATKAHQVEYLKAIGYFMDLEDGVTSSVAAWYKEHNPLKEIEDSDKLAFMQGEAIVRFGTMSNEQKKAILIKHYGVSFELPENDNRLVTIAYGEINNQTLEDDKFLKLILESSSVNSKTTENETDKISVLVAELVKNKILDFDTKTTQVSIKSDDGKKDIKLYEFDEGLERESRVVLFAEWLGTGEGANTYGTLKKHLKK